VRARVAHRLLVIVAQYISFDASNIQVVYKQAGMPGPQPTAGSALEGMDAVCLEVRKLGLHPQGTRTEMHHVSLHSLAQDAASCTHRQARAAGMQMLLYVLPICNTIIVRSVYVMHACQLCTAALLHR